MRGKGKVLEVEKEEEMIEVAKALASEPRMRIIEVLTEKKLNLNEISEIIDMPASSVTVNIKILEEAGLIETEYQPANRGSQKLCSRNYNHILFNLPDANIFKNDFIEIPMPIGNYYDFEVEPSCGLASEEKYIGIIDDPQCFLEPEHIYAQILWFSKGYVKYRFPNNLPSHSKLKDLELSMEICSEAPGYAKEWPSDITVSINDIEIGTWTCPGDMGGERGKLSPDWWNAGQTQYGLLKVWNVNSDASYIDGKKISSKTIDDLCIQANNSINVKIGVKEDTKNARGINIFGRKFGNYSQDIILRLNYEK